MFSPNFREFVHADPAAGAQFMRPESMEEEKDDIEKTLQKLPPSHAALVRDYRWKFHAGNTLNGDDEHVGYVDDAAKEIAMAGPWVYPREFTALHEVGHKVWEHFVTPELRKQWCEILAATKDRQHQEPEEMFCMAYAATYCKHPPLTHYHKNWVRFIKALPQ